MFRKSSKRDKEKEKEKVVKGGLPSPLPGDLSDNGLQNKRSSKLFSFGSSFKKDKKKHEHLHSSSENDAGELAQMENLSLEDAGSISSMPLNPLFEDGVQEDIKLPLKTDEQYSIDSQYPHNSPPSSLGIDFGTDSSLLFQNFTADVLKATEEKLQGVDLKLPEVNKETPKENVRIVTVKRGPAGDFGIALRRSTLNKKENSRIIHLVEPTNEKQVLGLLPGDCLVEVDGINVENFSREEIIDKVSNAADSVTLKVAPVPELSELTSRTVTIQQNSSSSSLTSRHIQPTFQRSGSTRNRIRKEVIGEDWKEESEKVWLLHSSGFSSGRLNKVKDEYGDVISHKVKLDHGGEVVDVDEGYVDKVNPEKFDKAEDLCSLRYLNESGCLHTLRQRYGGNLIHTYAGNCYIIIKPEETLGIYNNKVMKMFQGCKQEDMPPHIFAAAQTAYRSMMASNTNQSILLRGHAGSGKTFNLRQILRYLVTVAAAPRGPVSVSKVESALALLESFTHARTILSCNASFARLLFTLQFDSFGLITGLTIQNFFFDKARVSRHPPCESSYRIFYELLHGCSGKLRQLFMLDCIENEFNHLFALEQQFNDAESCREKWSKLETSLDELAISADEWKGVLAPIVAILHLGVAGVMAAPGSKPYFANTIFAQKAASILGTSEEDLARILFSTPRRSRSMTNLSRTSSTSSQPGSLAPSQNDLHTPSESGTPLPAQTTTPTPTVDPVHDACLYALEGFTAGLYSEALSALLRMINRSLNATSRVTSIINVFDSPGFQNKSSINKTCSFEDLCSNYCYEKLQWLTHHSVFTSQIDRFNRENIDWSYDLDPIVSPEVTITAIDKITVSSNRLKSTEAKGLFWIIEEEALRLHPNEVVLVDNIKVEHNASRGISSSVVTTDTNSPHTFNVSHLQSTMMIKYSTVGWLKRVREHPATKSAYGILTDSARNYISEVYSGHQSSTLTAEPSQTSANRKKSRHALSNMKKNSVGMQMKNQMDRIIETLDRTTIRFVFCLLPQAREGLRDPNLATKEADSKTELIFNIPFVRQQFKNACLLEMMRIHRQGFPYYMSFPDFCRRFDILIPKENKASISVLDGREAVCSMVKQLEIEERSFRIGLSQIFFRPGVLPMLEDTRDEVLSESITEFQSYCRGYLSRKKLEKRRIQSLAVRCIQKNLRNFIQVRHWQWWRLFTKVLPLLDVNRTECELQTKSTEVASLAGRIRSLEEDNTNFTDENARLKKKIQELSAQLSEIHSSASGADELLDQETLERMRLEEELERAKLETDRLSRQCESLENELCDLKLNSINNGKDQGSYVYQVDEDELEENDNVWRQKYAALSRELENTRRNLTDQAEEEIQELMNQKRATEKALTKERADGDEIRRQVANHKRKLNKVNSEMDDMRLLLETVQCRNSELEKKQKKFDQEVSTYQDEFSEEKTKLENAQKERDKLSNEKNNLQKELYEKDDEISQLKRKIANLESEAEDAASSVTDKELFDLKRQQRELEAKIQDQEEELDEQAGTIQQLEQHKTRLEMQLNREQQTAQKDLEAKDEELESAKTDHSRKIKALEEQLEEEVKRKDDVTRTKRELEQKVFDLESSVDDNIQERGMERKLKKELKRIKILYNDAKAALEVPPPKSNDSTDLKALRNQVEDADYAKHMALKAKAQVEGDLEEMKTQLDTLTQAKELADSKCAALVRDNEDLQIRVDELEDEMEEFLRSNKMLSAQLMEAKTSVISVKEASRKQEEENIGLVEKANVLTKKLEAAVNNKVEKTEVERLEVKVMDLECRIENDTATRIKQEHFLNRLRGQLDRAVEENNNLVENQSSQQNNTSKHDRQLKDCRNELENVKAQEAMQKRKREEAESEVHNLEDELSRKRTEIANMTKRIRELQNALERAEGTSDDDDLLDTQSESDESFASFGRSSMRRRQNPLLASRELVTSRRTPATDVSLLTGSTRTSYRTSRRGSTDDYAPTNGYLSREGSHDIDTYVPPSTTYSRTTSRLSSRMMSRQDSFE